MLAPTTDNTTVAPAETPGCQVDAAAEANKLSQQVVLNRIDAAEDLSTAEYATMSALAHMVDWIDSVIPAWRSFDLDYFARRAHVSRRTLCRALNRLEQGGYIIRTRAPKLEQLRDHAVTKYELGPALTYPPDSKCPIPPKCHCDTPAECHSGTQSSTTISSTSSKSLVDKSTGLPAGRSANAQRDDLPDSKPNAKIKNISDEDRAERFAALVDEFPDLTPTGCDPIEPGEALALDNALRPQGGNPRNYRKYMHKILSDVVNAGGTLDSLRDRHLPPPPPEPTHWRSLRYGDQVFALTVPIPIGMKITDYLPRSAFCGYDGDENDLSCLACGLPSERHIAEHWCGFCGSDHCGICGDEVRDFEDATEGHR